MSVNVDNGILPSTSQANDSVAPAKGTISLSQADLENLSRLPIDTLDTIRSKLVQLIDAITAFRSQLETLPLTPNSLSYPSLISKFLILLNHTEALSQALNTPSPSQPINQFELPSLRAQREEREKWEHGPSKRSVLGNLAAVPRGLEGLEDGKEWIIGVLTRTKLAPEIEKDEQELLSLLPPPPVTSEDASIKTLLEHTKSLTEAHENHISACREALHKARYGRPAGLMELDLSSDHGHGGEGDPRYEWKMRVEVDDQPLSFPSLECPPSDNPILKGLLGFMKDGRNPIDPSIH